MKKRLTGMCCCLLLSCAFDPSFDYGPIAYIDEGFESAALPSWESQYSSVENFRLTTDQPYEGAAAACFTIKAGGDYWLSPNNGSTTARSELQVMGVAPAGTEVYYSWHIKIDADYAESADWQVIGQFHDQPDLALGESWNGYPANSPPLAFKYREGQLVVAVYSWETAGVMDIALAPLSKGVWHELTTHVRWSTGDDGFIEAWLDDVPIVSPDGITRYRARNCFNQAGNYLKIGLYRSTSILTEATVYYDRIKSGPSWASVQ
ncbi:MAG: hypothetical protein A2004_01415 [Spirochaetes bacterium GWC1_61_12]|nr:MAG: hypothetical protein A2Y37_07415 [Spirochaetes bacterium GWB1_60_80]OHD34682.1 MAG: hypothetical protein A2004_01415 [Spirochaetes bacterium GWC1_61_12]OHD59223.1 MAG: hypothetical protein A2Y32_00380 [Spirochaetes bacterium GWF1_60_12]HAP43076.1 hypothetical protein [Spirochaetaceae bacterium]HAW86671.1 hypothetical protein [Spirochaetaceae bacterium]